MNEQKRVKLDERLTVTADTETGEVLDEEVAEAEVADIVVAAMSQTTPQDATALTVRKPNTYDLPVLQTVSAIFARSGLFSDSVDEARAQVKVIAGAELGVAAMAAMQNIYFIPTKQGVRVTFSAELQAAFLKRAGKYRYEVTEMTTQRCTITFYEKLDGTWFRLGVSAFTIDDAKQAGYLRGGSPWLSIPRNMLWARAMSNGCTWFCPDIAMFALNRPGELGDGAEVVLPDAIDPDAVRVVDEEAFKALQDAVPDEME